MTSDDVTRLMALKVYRLATTCLSLIILTGLTIYRFYESFEFESLSSWHPSFITLGFSLLMGQAILVLSDDNILTFLRPSLKKTAREYHWIMQILAAMCNLVGFVTKIVHKNITGRSHFQTTHAILGLVTIVLSFVAATGGIFTLYAAKLKDWVKPSYIKLIHTIIGIITFVLGVAAQATALVRFDNKNDDTGIICIVLLAFAAFVVFEGAVRHAYSRLIKLSS